MSAAQGDIMVGNVKSLVDRLSKDFSAAKPPLAIHEPRKTVMPKSTPVQHVITTFAYTAAQDDELSLELGDIIEVLEEVEDGWSRGRQLRTGIVGMFPTNFVKPDVTPAAASHREEEKVVIRHTGEVDLPEANRRTPSVVGGVNVLAGKTTHSDVRDEPKTKEMARVKFEYEPQHNDELRLGEIGQLITIIRKDCGDAGWFEGEINGRRGLFPDNFVELVQVPINTRSGTIYHQPTHHPKVITKAPAATPAGVVPPAVPAKPLKQKLSDGCTSINGASGTSPPTSNVTTAPASVLPSQVKQQNSAFAAARDRISKDLVVGQPGQVASKLTKSVIVTSGSESIATARPVSNIETDESADDVIKPLSHVTKNRVRPPGKRPVSMLIIKKRGSTDNLIESPTHATTSDVVEKNPFSGALSTSLSTSTTSPTSNSAKTSTSTVSAKILPVRPPPADVKKEEKRDHIIGGVKTSTPVTTHSSMTTSLSSSVDSEWVSRKEYNELLARLSSLEARVAQLERR